MAENPIPEASDDRAGAITNLSAIPAENLDEVVETGPSVREPSLPVIGYRLSRTVLWIISGVILLLILFLFVKPFDATPSMALSQGAAVPDSVFVRQLEYMRIVQAEKQHYREFFMQISQMILLNLLLPVLTAILGYIFAFQPCCRGSPCVTPYQSVGPESSIRSKAAPLPVRSASLPITRSTSASGHEAPEVIITRSGRLAGR